MTVSTVPAVLDAIVAAVRRHLPRVEVVDGQPVRQFEADVICIGHVVGDADEAVVENTLTRDQMATDPSRESYDITCMASSWAGDQPDPVIVRNRTYELVDGVVAAIAQDSALERLVMRAMVSTQLFGQSQTNRGAAAAIRFVIHIDAYTR